MPKVALHTLGCKLNFSETNAISEDFLKHGYKIVNLDEKADVYVINTCSVTENAEKECRQIVRRALRNNPNAFVAVTGCYAQLRPETITAIDGVDAVLGTNEKFEIFNKIKKFEKEELSCIYITPTENLDVFHSALSTEVHNRTRAFFKIQDGCDYKCSFCTIPMARGKSRSLLPDEVIAQFKKLLAAGYREIILTGVNVGDYGKSYNKNLYDVLKSVIKIPGDFRIRISSIEPNLLSDDIINITSESEKICNHFHIPLQSGSDKVLGLMQRRYHASFFEDLIYKIIEKIHDIGIGVDVIVGTPGESEGEFMKTYNLLQKLPIAYLHVFTYSERPGTKALEINPVVDIVERKRRNRMLRILSDKKRYSFYKNMIGKKVQVLFERDEKEGLMRGFSSNYIRVERPFDSALVNKFSFVEIKGIKDNFCIIKT